jgi:hypothetical protein
MDPVLKQHSHSKHVATCLLLVLSAAFEPGNLILLKHSSRPLLEFIASLQERLEQRERLKNEGIQTLLLFFDVALGWLLRWVKLPQSDLEGPLREREGGQIFDGIATTNRPNRRLLWDHSHELRLSLVLSHGCLWSLVQPGLSFCPVELACQIRKCWTPEGAKL